MNFSLIFEALGQHLQLLKNKYRASNVDIFQWIRLPISLQGEPSCPSWGNVVKTNPTCLLAIVVQVFSCRNQHVEHQNHYYKINRI